MESASKGGAEIAGESINKMGLYSRKTKSTNANRWKPYVCYHCGNTVNGSIIKHINDLCPSCNLECSKCEKLGHFAKCCKDKPVREISKEDTNDDNTDDTYSINVFRINHDHSFRVQIVTNMQLVDAIADTGAKISVCGSSQAKCWKLLENMSPTNIDGSCDTILNGRTAENLGIIKFHRQPGTFQPINIIESNNTTIKTSIQSCLQDKSHLFTGIGNLSRTR